MFPQYRDLITQLKKTNHHFSCLFDKHNTLDQKIKNLEVGIEIAIALEIEPLKKKSFI
jgi:uncharacterized protein YdcH (DUF465 family)